MFDSHSLLRRFHDRHIRLTNEQKADMTRRRDINIDRLMLGLEDIGAPPLVATISQGGYAMQTMTQPPEADTASRYDIDTGVVFAQADAPAARRARQRVCEALQAKTSILKSPPEMKMKCVRVIYAEGYQCDFPVFRKVELGNHEVYEIATGDEWFESDPESMNRWFEDQLKTRSPKADEGYQPRRIVRYLKYICKVATHFSRTKYPAGLLVTALTVESYVPSAGRDDFALRETLRRLSRRSPSSMVESNGIVVSDEKDQRRIERLVFSAHENVALLDELENLELSEDATKRAWSAMFRHSFFGEPPALKLSAKAPNVTRLDTENLEGKAAAAFGVLNNPTPRELRRRAEAAATLADESAQGHKIWSA